jgi:di/tricarboxylate transporter
MTPEIMTVLGLLLLALILFGTEKIPIDIVTIILVLAMVLTGTLTSKEALAGFGDEIIITIAGLFILTGGLVKTGVVDIMGRRLHRIAGGNEFRLMTLVMLVAAAAASVMKNTTTTAMLVPVILGLSARAKLSPSRLLMPLAFGAILGGSCTLIGTSTNLAVSGAIVRMSSAPELASVKDKLAPYTMFELTTVGVLVALGGIAYMLLLGRLMLPRHAAADSLTEQYHIREFITEVVILRGSPLAGRTLSEANINEELDLTVLSIIRNKRERIAPGPSVELKAEDLLIVQGRVADILKIKNAAGLEIKADFKLSDTLLETREIELFEVMILRSSEFAGRTLKGLRFRQRFGVTALAINRHGVTFLSKISTVTLRFGDVLLVQGPRVQIEQLAADGNILLLEDVTERRGRGQKKKWAVIAFLLFLFLSVTKLTPLPVAVLLGVMTLLASQAVRTQELYDLVEWRLLVLIAGMISFGVAMEKTKADQYLADMIVRYVGPYGSKAVLAGFFILTVALTQPMSNQAASLVVVPIAVKTAMALGLNPRTFAVAVTYAASCSFLTPLEPACVLVYTPGQYRFMDFVKIGALLTMIVFVLSMVLIPIFWPL